MAKNHSARQQKRMAKHKAKRTVKRSLWSRLNSTDPAIRLQNVEKLTVVQTLMGSRLWDDGIGHLTIARQESTGGVIFAVFLVDVYCLGVKNAFWRTGTRAELEKLVRHLDESQKMSAITPACLVKIVKGAVEYAQSFGFVPHPDYRHAAMLLEGIDPSSCPNEYVFGRDGKPFYIQGPNESAVQAKAISQRIESLGGHFLIALSAAEARALNLAEGDFEVVDLADEDESPDESD